MQCVVYWGPQRQGSGGPNHLAPALGLRKQHRILRKRLCVCKKVARDQFHHTSAIILPVYGELKI